MPPATFKTKQVLRPKGSALDACYGGVGLMGRIAGARQVARGDVRAFLAAATEGKDLGDLQVCADEVAAAAEGVNINDAASASAFEKKLDVGPLPVQSLHEL